MLLLLLYYYVDILLNQDERKCASDTWKYLKNPLLPCFVLYVQVDYQ